LHLMPWVAVVLLVALAIAGMQTASADQTLTRTLSVQLSTGDSLVVQSNRESIEQVFVQGNFSATNMTRPAHYPVSDYAIQAFNPGSFELRFIFNYPTEYQINLLTRSSNPSSPGNSTTYYLSGGSF